MHGYIQISKLNDFLFCPFSLYFHSVYEGTADFYYKSKPQIAGKLAHKSIEDNTFSSRKDILQDFNIFSDKYGLIGKLDVYDIPAQKLIERKRQIKRLHLGQQLQVYAQKVCLEEMGYKVKEIVIYSLVDKKKYKIDDYPYLESKLEETLQAIRSFDLSQPKNIRIEKCQNCIYSDLCRKMYGSTT